MPRAKRKINKNTAKYLTKFGTKWILKRGETFEWIIVNKNLLLLKRVKKQKNFKSRKIIL